MPGSGVVGAGSRKVIVLLVTSSDEVLFTHVYWNITFDCCMRQRSQ